MFAGVFSCRICKQPRCTCLWKRISCNRWAQARFRTVLTFTLSLFVFIYFPPWRNWISNSLDSIQPRVWRNWGVQGLHSKNWSLSLSSHGCVLMEIPLLTTGTDDEILRSVMEFLGRSDLLGQVVDSFWSYVWHAINPDKQCGHISAPIDSWPYPDHFQFLVGQFLWFGSSLKAISQHLLNLECCSFLSGHQFHHGYPICIRMYFLIQHQGCWLVKDEIYKLTRRHPLKDDTWWHMLLWVFKHCRMSTQRARIPVKTWWWHLLQRPTLFLFSVVLDGLKRLKWVMHFCLSFECFVGSLHDHFHINRKKTRCELHLSLAPWRRQAPKPSNSNCCNGNCWGPASWRFTTMDVRMEVALAWSFWNLYGWNGNHLRRNQKT